MRAWNLLVLMAAFQIAQTGYNAKHALEINKCCGPLQMLSGDGSSCVNASLPRNHTLRDGSYELRFSATTHYTYLQPGDAPWVDRWLPPGVPFHRVKTVHFHYLDYLNRREPQLAMWTVDKSAEWDESQAEAMGSAYFRRRVIFLENKFKRSVFGPDPRPLYNSKLFGLGLGGYRPAFQYCVDAAQPPLGPFALIMEPDCEFDACVRKCCKPWELVVARKRGGWVCWPDQRAHQWPRNSSFARLLPPQDAEYYYPSRRNRETCLKSQPVTTRPLRLPPDDKLAVHLLQRRYHDYMWSTWETCVDMEMLKNRALTETIFYCTESRITRGVYWLLRHLSFVSVSLLVVALASVACNSGMRLKAHGWCLACHASCLLGFNLGQVTYYMTISDQVNAFGFAPPHLRNTCRSFALLMYFLLMAANYWLSALCFNMAWGFRKLQMVRPGGGKDWKRFLVFSAVAWGLPSLMTGLCAILHEKDEENRKWFSPSLTETRTCFNEVVILKQPNESPYVSSYQSGTALFYYGPVCILTIVNAMCIGRTLRKVQFLRRGNSVLHREEDKVAQTPRKADGESAQGDNTRSRNAARSTIADAKTIRLYVKIILMTGVIDLISEIIGWVTIPTYRVSVENSLRYYNKYLFLQEHMMAYRATGYVTDCFRAACVVWLAAPDGGYFGALRGWLRFNERGRGDGRRLAGRP